MPDDSENRANQLGPQARSSVVRRGAKEISEQPGPKVWDKCKPVEFRLNSGRTLKLDSIFQYHTYGGLIEGVPDAEMNKKTVAKALEYAAEKLQGPPHRTPPYLIEPIVCKRPYYPSPGLPGVACLAHFESSVRLSRSLGW